MNTLLIYSILSEGVLGEEKNLQFFLDHGVYPDKNREYIFLIHSNKLYLSKLLPFYSNVKFLETKETTFENQWKFLLNTIDLSKFNNFGFLNSTCRGPFLPLYMDKRNWYLSFINLFQNQETNFVTSMIYENKCLNNILFTNLKGIYTLKNLLDENKDLNEIYKSINIVSLCPLQRKKLDNTITNNTNTDDILKTLHFYIEPLDSIFFPTNVTENNILSSSLEKYTVLSDCDTNSILKLNKPFDLLGKNFLNYLCNEPGYPTAWRGHLQFANWLVCKLNPKIIVDLGVDYGHSTFAWSMSGIGQVFGIDWFQGDDHASFRNTYHVVLNRYEKFKKEYNLKDNIHIIKGDFNEIFKTFNKKIDILHIDGLHTYEAVKNDFEKWSTLITEEGVIVMHDTESFPNDVGRFYNEIKEPFYKDKFLHGYGLAFVSKSKKMIEMIQLEWKNKLENKGEFLYHPKYDILINHV